MPITIIAITSGSIVLGVSLLCDVQIKLVPLLVTTRVHYLYMMYYHRRWLPINPHHVIAQDMALSGEKWRRGAFFGARLGHVQITGTPDLTILSRRFRLSNTGTGKIPGFFFRHLRKDPIYYGLFAFCFRFRDSGGYFIRVLRAYPAYGYYIGDRDIGRSRPWTLLMLLHQLKKKTRPDLSIPATTPVVPIRHMTYSSYKSRGSG